MQAGPLTTSLIIALAGITPQAGHARSIVGAQGICESEAPDAEGKTEVASSSIKIVRPLRAKAAISQLDGNSIKRISRQLAIDYSGSQRFPKHRRFYLTLAGFVTGKNVVPSEARKTAEYVAFFGLVDLRKRHLYIIAPQLGKPPFSVNSIPVVVSLNSNVRDASAICYTLADQYKPR